MSKNAPLLIGIYGPTASGKTALAEKMAAELDAQLINADAFQAYRYMDIGTAKPENKEQYELLDILDPDESFGVGDWVLRACALLERLFDEGRNAIVVGGTGLYLRALFEEYAEMGPPPSPALRADLEKRLHKEGLQALVEELQQKDPDRAARTDLLNPSRVRRALELVRMGLERIDLHLPSFIKVKVGLDLDKTFLDAQIEQRVYKMLQNGWVDEVDRLIRMGYSSSCPAFRAIGYGEVFQLASESIDRDEAAERIIVSTRQYAKRQNTWLRSEPRLNRIVGFGYDSAVFARAMDCII